MYLHMCITMQLVFFLSRVYLCVLCTLLTQTCVHTERSIHAWRTHRQRYPGSRACAVGAQVHAHICTTAQPGHCAGCSGATARVRSCTRQEGLGSVRREGWAPWLPAESSHPSNKKHLLLDWGGEG